MLAWQHKPQSADQPPSTWPGCYDDSQARAAAMAGGKMESMYAGLCRQGDFTDFAHTQSKYY